jgi:hypothetical protein
MTDPVVPPAAPAYQPAPVGQKTNTLAIVGFILSFFVTVAGIIVSVIALRQIKQTGEGGHGFALAGLIIGIVGTVIWVIYIIVAVAALAFEGAALGAVSNY